jgi:hypothetical protein
MANEIHVDYESGSTLYAVVRDAAGQVWCPASQEFEAWGAGGHDAADYALPLVDKDGSRYTSDFDDAIPIGSYSVQVFLQAGANPVDTDALVVGRDFVWTGTGELTPLKILANRAVQDKVTGMIDFYDDDDETVLLTLTPWDTEASLERTSN